MYYWLKDIDNNAADILNKYSDARDFGKSNPFIIEAENLIAGKLTFNLLGANLQRFEFNNGLPIGAKVDYGYSTYTYKEFLANTMNSPFQVGILRIETNNPNQFVASTTSITFIENDPTGKQTRKGLALARRLNQFTQDAIEYDLTDYDIVIDGDLLMNITLNPADKLKFLFYPSARASFKMLMNEGYLAKKNTMPSLPLVPNRTIQYTPLEVKLNERTNSVIV